jgi:hypothetical protein
VLSAQCSVLSAQCSVLSAQCSVLSAQCSVLSAQCSVLSAQCSSLIAQRSALSAQRSALEPPLTVHRSIRCSPFLAPMLIAGPSTPLSKGLTIAVAVFVLACIGGLLWVANQLLPGIEARQGRVALRDAAALPRLEASAVPPSPAARALFCQVQGYQDSSAFMSYLDSPEHLAITAQRLSGKPLDQWPSFDGSSLGASAASQAQPPLPTDSDERYAPALIREGKRWAVDEGPRGWTIIIDLRASRLLYHSWST